MLDTTRGMQLSFLLVPEDREPRLVVTAILLACTHQTCSDAASGHWHVCIKYVCHLHFAAVHDCLDKTNLR